MKRTGVWGGRTTEERRAERRDRMIAAAIDIWSEHGWAAITMRGVCSRTSLSDRYFYDEFTDRDGLLVAVWQSIQDGVLGAVATAYAQGGPRTNWEELTRAATTVLVDQIIAEPAKAKILLSRNEGSQILESHRRGSFQNAIELVLAAAKPRLKPGFDEEALRMDVVIAVGGFIELLRAWQSGMITVDSTRIVEHTCGFVSRFGGRYLQSH